ncbi:YdcF family protein [Lederbergia graminis]|uniref:YdcF family protein n=1 Tax=Lederbergia graminis TaxID=735518 RepID=A0ABW0LP68_9BACI
METLKKIIIILLIIIVLIVGFWMMTGEMIKSGKFPEARGKNEYAIILGAKVDGESPSLSLRYRLNAALHYAMDNPHVHLILSGGQGSGEQITEAEAMKRFLIDYGIDEERLIIEDKSTSTYENILFSKKLIPDSTDSITIITSDYHLARAKKIASNLGLEADVVAAETPDVVSFQLNVRERFALVKTYIFGK